MASDHRGRGVHAGRRTNQEMADFGELTDHVSFEGFDFGKWYDHEKRVLTPRLEEKGFTNIRFGPGESDSWGPLSRVAYMTDSQGRRGKAWYA